MMEPSLQSSSSVNIDKTQEEEMDSSEYDVFSDASVESNLSESEIRTPGNLAWADAMSRVLNTKVSKEKGFILSKAKKDTDIKEKKKEEIEMVDESGHVVQSPESSTQSKTASLKAKTTKKKMEKCKERALWESMCRVKPDITQREKERELVRIATRGVVHLFNTVEKHQKSKKSPKEKNRLREEKLGKVKGNFMDILKGQFKNEISQDDPAMKKGKKEETWNILKDDFMMGAEMKDWDKESDND